MRPDNSGVIVWRKTKKTKQTRRGQSTSYTSLNQHVMAERTAPPSVAPDTETSSFWAWCCCINSFITNHTQASCAQKYHLIITCTTDRSQVTTVLKVPKYTRNGSFRLRARWNVSHTACCAKAKTIRRALQRQSNFTVLRSLLILLLVTDGKQ